MTQSVDYSKLSRRELQALCKQHKIPANKTNVFMAEALDALLNNAPRQQEEFQEEEIPAPDSPEVDKVVERVKGKRATQKAFIGEAELDSLSGLLAHSSLISAKEATHQAAESPRASDERVMGENVLPLAPLVVAAKGRRGRPRVTKKEETAVEEKAAKSLEVDTAELNGLEACEGSVIEDLEGWAKSSPEIVPEKVSSPFQVVPKCDVQLEESAVVYVRTKNFARTQVKITSEQVEATEPDVVEGVEFEATAANSEAVAEGEETVPEPIEEMDITLSPAKEMVSETFAEDAESDLPPPEAVKISRKPKRGGSKSRRIAEPEVDAVVEMPEEKVEVIESDRESTSASAEPVLQEDVEKVSPLELTVVTEKESPAPVEKKTRKPKKAGSKSRRVKEVEFEAEVESREQVVLDAATYSMSKLSERLNNAEAEKSFPWTVPTPVLEEELPPAPIVLKEKPKARKTKKASAKARRNAEQPADIVNDACGEYLVEPEAAVVGSRAETAVNELITEAVKEGAEPVTPVKKVANEKENEEKDALHSLSLRKLKGTLKEKENKKKGLQSRGSSNTCPLKL